ILFPHLSCRISTLDVGTFRGGQGAVVVPGKEDLCEAFLRNVPNKFQHDQIEMKWLENNSKDLPEDATNIEKE
ncbi:hypothetical protein Gogos_019368, partial [Gossypium gossypioides]|nr:hypothetical protein [Gossypium gossypioides]